MTFETYSKGSNWCTEYIPNNFIETGWYIDIDMIWTISYQHYRLGFQWKLNQFELCVLNFKNVQGNN